MSSNTPAMAVDAYVIWPSEAKQCRANFWNNNFSLSSLPTKICEKRVLQQLSVAKVR